MDYVDSGQTSEFSVTDVFNQEIKTEMEEFLNSEASPFGPEHDTGGGMSLGLDLGHGLHSGDGIGVVDVELSCLDHSMSHAISTPSYNVVDSLITSPNPMNFSNLSSPEKYGLEPEQNIFVDPQTGLPANQTTTIGGTHIHAQQINLFVNNLSDTNTVQIPQSRVATQGIRRPPTVTSPNSKYNGVNGMSLNASLQIHQFSNLLSNASRHSNNSQQQQNRAREFQTFQLQNEHGQILGSPVKNGTKNVVTHRNNNITNHRTKCAPYQLKPPMRKGANGFTKQSKVGAKHLKEKPILDKIYNKPGYSYSCLITMALKNSKAGCLPVSEIYYFMCENFPYFKTAKDGWKNSVRHNLSLNKCFAKVETPMPNVKTGKKGCLWALNPERAAKMEEEVHKSTKRDPNGIKMCMAKPEDFPKIEALSRLTINPNKLSMPKTTASKPRTKPTLMATKHNHATKTISSNKTVHTSCAPATPIIIKRESDEFAALAHDIFNTDFPFFESCLPPLDGDLCLQDNLVDPLHYDISSFSDLPITTSPTPLSLCNGLLDASPTKDNTSFNSSCLTFENSAQTMLSNSPYYSPNKSRPLSAFL